MNTVSIIIPSYNRPAYLKEAVISSINQTIKPKEIFIIDDGSDSIHVDEILKLEELDSCVKIFLQKGNKGVSRCRNIGLKEATGKYIIFLDDDDTLNPDMIKHSLANIGEYDAVSCRTNVFSDKVIINESPLLKTYNWQSTAPFSTYSMEDNPAEHLSLYHPMIHSFLVKKSCLEGIYFPEDLNYGEDFMVWLSLCIKGCKFKKANFIGANYRIHGENDSLKVGIDSKLKFYEKILTELKLSNRIKNITYIKMMKILLFNFDLRFVYYLLKSLIRIDYLIIHLSHFLRVSKYF